MTAQPHNRDLPEPAPVASIDRCLPQTQCTKCGYPRCLEYARAIAAGEADINQCPPGGDTSIAALARLLDCETKPLNPRYGRHQPLRLAFIRESDCIGCALCIKACPVDCIIGAAKRMHTVVAAECTGCELCLPVCPTDCIVMTDAPPAHAAGAPSAWPEFSRRQVDKARLRTRHKQLREAKRELARTQQKRERRRKVLQKEILAAVQRKQSAASFKVTIRPPVKSQT